MSTFVNLNGNPDDVVGTGVRLKGQADDFGAQAKSILDEIEAIEGAAPWGKDEPGQSFVKSYNQVPKDSKKPFSQAMRDELSTAGEQLGKTGDAIVDAVVQYQSADAINETDISKI